ncbi:MAG: cupin domain-containing protein [Candidatus Thorarchaeota archaeon]|nr:cupin domain-containing protein [Candidatus Thorarchaeota archaeon]
MVKVYRASDAEEIARAGYVAKYVADIRFRKKIDNGGFIMVSIPAGSKTSPHIHKKLEEVFVALSSLEMYIDATHIQLEVGDIVIAEPGESHSFSAYPSSQGKILAIKLPNLKEDKIQLDSS